MSLQCNQRLTLRAADGRGLSPPPEGIQPRKAFSIFGIFLPIPPPAANACRWAASQIAYLKGLPNAQGYPGESYMDETIEYKYSPKFTKEVSREFLLKRMGAAFVFSILLGLYGIISLLFGNTGFFEGVALTLFIIYVFNWFRLEKQAVEQAKSLPNESIAVTFNDDGITFNNIDHFSTVKWRRFHSVTKLKSAWLFFTYSNSNYTAIPSNLINASLKALIEKKMAENHKPIN